MNNFNQVCPTGNHMTEWNPAEEYADSKREAEENDYLCDECGKEISELEYIRDGGLCGSCFIKEARGR